MTADPMLEETDVAGPSIRLRNGALVEIPVGRDMPALTYEDALAILPDVDELMSRLDRLRAFVVDTIEQDCEANDRSELLIDGKPYVYKGGTTYRLEKPSDLRAALMPHVGKSITQAELDAAVISKPVPASMTWAVHNGRINDLKKKGGEIKKIVEQYRDEDDAPKRLAPKK